MNILSSEISEVEAFEAEDARYLAQTNIDIDAMESLFGDDLIYQHSTGAVDDKASFIKSISSGAVRYRKMNRSEVKFRTYGYVAIITGKAQFEVSVNGVDSTARVRFHSIWVKRKTKLQFVSWQATLL
jgi:hypothetical protein